MNVIGSRPDGGWSDRTAAMERLTAGLDTLARQTGEPVTVVFDGRPRAIRAERVDVRFASRRGPNAADDDIAALVSADDDAPGLSVVTSDAALASRARAARPRGRPPRGGEDQGAAARGQARARRRSASPPALAQERRRDDRAR